MIKMTKTQWCYSVFIRLVLLVPGARPENVVITLVQTRDVFVQWDSIPREQVHGILLGYRVTYYDYRYWHMETITANHTQVVIKNLIPAMRYELRVSGFTAQGNGPSAYQYFTTS